MIGTLQKSIDELQNYLRHWSENLSKELSSGKQKPGTTVGVSFEPSYVSSSMAQMEPLELGFYCLRCNPKAVVEVVGQETQMGLVVMENATGVEGQVIAEVISYELFSRIFEKCPMANGQ